MKHIAAYKSTKTIVAILALVLVWASVFSMAAMKHPSGDASCMSAMSHGPECNSAQQSKSCIEFLFSLIEKFSHGYSAGASIKLLAVLSVLGLLFISSANLFGITRKFAAILKARLRRLLDNTSCVFQDILGFWITLVEKRDPSYALLHA